MKFFLFKNLLRNNSKWGDIYTPFGICPLAAEKAHIGLPIDRLVDRPMVKKLTVEPFGRPPGQPCPEPERNGSLAGRPPGRPGQPQSGLTLVGRPLGRPTKHIGLCARLVHIGQPVRSTDHWFGPIDRPLVRSTRAWQGKIQDLKTGLFIIK